ncbi:helix-turn-helix transcriptional regulator [Geomonas subterranea]|uniref:Helix-turn-helix transcriptional regulator n=2 Tax=Geomonas subterranea TaxID=2847989 RepID=A0ABX8LLY1_9BACT|nr:helix-turn-helix transcriptional regulator [Geomonas subterranea]QXM11697.1 helix-turn-helix transcriptional regulator [Geomonas subterranea]
MPPRQKQQYRHLPAFILLALAEEPIHGGAILSALSQRMPLSKPDSAAVYRALQRLEDEAQVVSNWDTSGSGPARRVYRLTEAGWEKLDAWREDIEMRLANLRYFLDTYAELRSHRRLK